MVRSAVCNHQHPDELQCTHCWPQVDPTYILSEELAALTEEKCPEGALTPGCAGLNKTPVCEAITSDSIYGGEREWWAGR